MCGRFTQTLDYAALEKRFGLTGPPLELAPRYNLAPGQEAAVVLPGEGPGRRRLARLRWGLAPAWAKEGGPRPINARAEGIQDKPMFRAAFRARRCLVPADGFFEWQSGPAGKTPHLFRRRDHGLFALAGLWEKAPDGEPAQEDAPGGTFTVVTTMANEMVGRIHPRMPVMLLPDNEALWLETGGQRLAELAEVMEPYPAGEMASHPVSPACNSAANDGPECVAPVDPPPQQGGLFNS